MDFKNKIILAPMAQINDIAFRSMCKKYGADIVYSEMINCNALSRNNKATIKMTQTTKNESPIALQLFGTRLENITKAVKIIESKCDIIDFNLGCPASKIIKQGSGAALTHRPQKVFDIIECLVSNTDKPVTAKIRTGFRKKNYLEIAKKIEKAGASAITIHPRTVKQAYSGKSDWNVIKEIKEELSIPVIGNGDIWNFKDAQKMFDETNCDSIMIGRASIGNPKIFQEIKKKTEFKYLKEDKINLFKEYLELYKKYDITPFAQAKVQALYFLKGFKDSSILRNKIAKIKNMKELLKNI